MKCCCFSSICQTSTKKKNFSQVFGFPSSHTGENQHFPLMSNPLIKTFPLRFGAHQNQQFLEMQQV